MKVVKITGGCYGYWYRDFSQCLFEFVSESDTSFSIKRIEGFDYPYAEMLNNIFGEDETLPVAKYDVEFIK